MRFLGNGGLAHVEYGTLGIYVLTTGTSRFDCISSVDIFLPVYKRIRT